MMLDSIVDFLYMDGYGSYVWFAYGGVFTVLLANLFWLSYKLKRTKRSMKDWVKNIHRESSS